MTVICAEFREDNVSKKIKNCLSKHLILIDE